MNTITAFAMAHPFWTYIIAGIAFAIYRLFSYDLEYLDRKDKESWLFLIICFAMNVITVVWEAPRILIWNNIRRLAFNLKWKYRKIKWKKEQKRSDKMLQEMEYQIKKIGITNK